MEPKKEEQNDELLHWGIKDMRWGRRRYQNPDGSLTPAGKERYYGKGRSVINAERYGTSSNNEKERIDFDNLFSNSNNHSNNSGNSSSNESNSQNKSSNQSQGNEERLDIDSLLKNSNGLRNEFSAGAKKSKGLIDAIVGFKRSRRDPKDLSGYTNEQLQAVITRKNLENNFRQVMSPAPPKNSVSAKYVMDGLEAVGGLAVTGLTISKLWNEFRKGD